MATTDYNKLSKNYTAFIQREKAYNSNIIAGTPAWYTDAVNASTHFASPNLGGAAKREYSVLKRIRMLDAYESVSAKKRAYDLRSLNYTDFFTRQDVSLADDNAKMVKKDKLFHNDVNLGTGQIP